MVRGHAARAGVLSVCLILWLAACVPIQPVGPAASAPSATAAGDRASGDRASGEAAPAADTAAYPIVHAAPDCDYGGAVRSIEAPDARTVRITLCQPDANLAYKLSGGQFSMTDAGTLEATGGGGDLLTHPNGTGPFRLVDWGADRVLFERFNDYWGEPARAQRLDFGWSTDSNARLAALQAGKVDGIHGMSAVDTTVVKADPALQVVTLPPLHVDYVGLNNRMPPLDNPRVRQALAMAIDRGRILTDLYPPGSLVPSQVMPPSVSGYVTDATWYDYDPEAARAILEEEGVAGMTMDLSYSEDATNPAGAEAVAAQLADVGVTVNLVNGNTYADYFGSLVEGDVGALNYIGWFGGPDGTDWVVLFGRDAGFEFGDGIPEVWDAIDAIVAVVSPEERQPHYNRIVDLLKENVPLIPIAHGAGAAGYRADVTGVIPVADALRVPFAAVQPADRATFRWLHDDVPSSAYCPDEMDMASDFICRQTSETLVTVDVQTLALAPALATDWSVSDDLTEWTFTLREGVTFHDGASFDADDVVTSLVAIWDAAHPLHVGRTGAFEAWGYSFGAHLNAPEE